MRKEFSRKTRRLAWERANGRCEGGRIFFQSGELKRLRCTAPIDLGRFHYDHIIPEWISRDSSLDNCQVLCHDCHAAKTAGDQGDIAKVQRIRDKQIKAKTSKRPMPFGRNSRYKRKIGGQVVPR